MADPRLVPYIKRQLAAGYDVNTVRNFLIRNGYDVREVNEAVDFIYAKPKKKIPLWLIAAILGAAVLIIIILFFTIGGEKPSEVIFEQPEVFFPEEEEIIQEELVPEEELIEGFEEEIPEEELIMEEPEEILEPQCPPSCDDFDACTTDYCSLQTAYQCVNEDIIPCCGNGVCDTGESYSNCPADCGIETDIAPLEETVVDVIERAEELAESSPSSAANYCSDLDDQSFKDSCYVTVADVAENSAYCEPIFSTAKKDSCYTTAALDGDFSVCEKMTNEYLKTSCENLAAAS